jgi:hypothetical protein
MSPKRRRRYRQYARSRLGTLRIVVKQPRPRSPAGQLSARQGTARALPRTFRAISATCIRQVVANANLALPPKVLVTLHAERGEGFRRDAHACRSIARAFAAISSPLHRTLVTGRSCTREAAAGHAHLALESVRTRAPQAPHTEIPRPVYLSSRCCQIGKEEWLRGGPTYGSQ